jgi:hypothetical protein
MNELRDRIAAAIGGVDDWRGVTDPAILADAVIQALDLAKPCVTAGCRMRQIARNAQTKHEGRQQQ